MIQWSLVAVLVLVSLPGIGVALPRTVEVVRKKISKMAGSKKLPSTPVLVTAQVIQAMVVTTLFAIAGSMAAARTGLGAPFFEALLSDASILDPLRGQGLPGLGLGIAGALVFLLAYYLVFRPRLDAETVRAMESLRMRNGVLGRVLYGGIVEEVMFRFGCMNLLVWGLSRVTGTSGWGIIWISIVASGILFGLGHIPSYRQAGCAGTRWFITTQIALNLWATCIFGWLFAAHGLLAAMIAHATFHLVWLPFDRLFASTDASTTIITGRADT